MRILFVVPYPPSRIRVRSYGFLQQLRREHEVVVLALCSSERELADVEVLRGQGYEVVMVQESGWEALLRSGLAVAVGMVPCGHPRSLQVAYARSRRFVEVFEGLCMRRHFDVVHVEHVRGMAAIEPLARDLPVVWDAVDCLSLLYKYTMVAGPSLAMRVAARIEQKRLQEYEARMVKSVRQVVVTSERDRQALIELGHVQVGNGVCSDSAYVPCRCLSLQATAGRGLEGGVGTCFREPLCLSDGGAVPTFLSGGEASPDTGVSLQAAFKNRRACPQGSTIEVVPNGVDLDYFCPLPEQRRRFTIVFSGTMSYHPNVATALYLYRQIMPLIWRERPEVRLTLVGSSPPKVIRRLAGDGRVEVTGFVEDMRPYIGRAEVMLCPMVYGVGIQNKVLEAMALGTPVVVTPQVAEVFEVCQGRDLLVAESPEKFAEAALRLLDDAGRRSTLSQYGRAYVEEHHDWRVATEKLVDMYQQVRGEMNLAPYRGRNARCPT